MGLKKRKYHSAAFKAKVALAASQERMTINQIASQHEIHPNLVTQWKRQMLETLPDCFARNRSKPSKEKARNNELYQIIGQLKVQLEWLKKKSESIRG